MTYIPKFPMERDKVVSDKEKVLAKKPDIRLHNDGQDFICMDCGTVMRRTRTNPFPEHKCKADTARRLK